MPTDVDLDPTLRSLLCEELAAHHASLDAVLGDRDALRRTLHSLKASVPLLGRADLAREIAEVADAFRAGQSVEGRVRALISAALEAARGTHAARDAVLGTARQSPDATLTMTDPLYLTEMRERLAEFRDLPSGETVEATVRRIRRLLHSMKGASSLLSHHALEWRCHALEDELTKVPPQEDDVAKFVATAHAELLALVEGELHAPSDSSAHAPDKGSSQPTQVPTVRVAFDGLSRVIERLERLSRDVEEMQGGAGRLDARVRDLLSIQRELSDALRLIGPAKPWGAPEAALARIRRASDRIATISDASGLAAHGVRARTSRVSRDLEFVSHSLLKMQRSDFGPLFRRLSALAMREAKRAAKLVTIRTRGAAETIDRRWLESLSEPLAQVVKNAIAHGIESPDVRSKRGKPPFGTLMLSATRVEGRLVIAITDDGQGVDVDAIRARATQRGMCTASAAAVATESEVLRWLFMPGFSTQEAPDLAAGRGLGLDIVRACVSGLGGTVHGENQPGQGFALVVNLPSSDEPIGLMLVEASGREFAIPSHAVWHVRAPASVPAAVSLAWLLSGGAQPLPRRRRVALALDPDHSREAALWICVDGVGGFSRGRVAPATPSLASIMPLLGLYVGPGAHPVPVIDPVALSVHARWRVATMAPQ